MSVAQKTGVVTGAELLVAALEAHGVEIVFGIPGQHALSLWEALADSPIRTVVVRHEQAAAFAAVGYARTTGRVGVCITSTGPVLDARFQPATSDGAAISAVLSAHQNCG